MKRFIKEKFWLKSMPSFYFKYIESLPRTKCYKFYFFFINFMSLLLMKFIFNCGFYYSLLHHYKSLFGYFNVYKHKITNNFKKKYIQKGYKSKKLGIYFRNFLSKRYEDEYKNNNKIETLNNNCYLIMRFKRKNLFLTLLNTAGDVLCKTNIGSCGFKKKVKFTGYAIKRTSKKFYKRIAKSFVKTIYITRKNLRKNRYKLRNSILLENEIKLKRKIKLKKNLKLNKKLKLKLHSNKSNIKKRGCNISFFLKRPKIYNKESVRSNFFKQKVLKNYDNYRNYYPDILNTFRNSLNVIIRIKSSLKFWGFRFVTYGFVKRFPWFNGAEIRLPVAHSKGLRLRKKRRI